MTHAGSHPTASAAQPVTMTEESVLRAALGTIDLAQPARDKIVSHSATWVAALRAQKRASMMELFLSEYGLSTQEGVALMCLAEALLRVPDAQTMDDLIEDKIAAKEWGSHLGHSHSPLINASTWALFLTGQVLDEGKDASILNTLKGAVKRLGEPVIRTAVHRAMREMGRQFVLGETIQSAKARAAKQEAKGYTYSYDMLGEAAMTEADAARYFAAYAAAINDIAHAATSPDIRQNPGISIKLSALYHRYEPLQRAHVMTHLVPKTLELAQKAKAAKIGLTIDAEEAERLELSLDVIEAVLSDPSLAGWDGFGVVVQAYSLRAAAVIDRLYDLATRLDRNIMIRLVKGAYWDTEIKHAQVEGHGGYPVFTHKAATDVNYISCAQQLLGYNDRMYPQFATHNAHTMAAVLELSDADHHFEFQRLHGMGEALHELVKQEAGRACRIYAPVGAHRDLLAYLVRRLLENGANSSFVHKIVDLATPARDVVADPIAMVEALVNDHALPLIDPPAAMFGAARVNSKGLNIGDAAELSAYLGEVAQVDLPRRAHHRVGRAEAVINPATLQTIGTAYFMSADDADAACARCVPWSAPVHDRAQALLRAADLYEAHSAELTALLMQEAGKTLLDCIAEIREAVDFLRFYATQACAYSQPPRGVFACIAPWNFPLAIFTGQIAAALATGNGALAKPAETTPLIADLAVQLMHQGGVPEASLVLINGYGGEVGPVLAAHDVVSGVAFTGSTATAQRIHRTLAQNRPADSVLIAETGGLNAMIVDSTALLEQAVRDIVASAFQSAGQRCSALRVLYVQEDVADALEHMLFGAMDALRLGDPMATDTDVGPIIDAAAHDKIARYIADARAAGRVLHQGAAPVGGYFMAPAALRVAGIADVREEIFGPVLHIARYKASDLDAVIDAINATGYGLTFGVHTRIDARVQHMIERVNVGNLYVNRNQIGAVVGVQPFGGYGLSGTGPKAGGPLYLRRFLHHTGQDETPRDDVLHGPTGESNRYMTRGLDHVLCLGPSAQDAQAQAHWAAACGCTNVQIASLDAITGHTSAVLFWGEASAAQAVRQELAEREGPITRLILDRDADQLCQEVCVCVDTTASGGNVALLAMSE